MKSAAARVRAIDDNDKALKRQSILRAAASLFREQSDQLPSVLNIANACGLAKGTVYLYFKTKEEIFLVLLEAEFDQLFTALETCLTETAVTDSRSELTHSLLQVILQFIDDHPMFMPLAGLSGSVIEQNVEEDVMVRAKTKVIQRMETVGALLHRHFPHMQPQEGSFLLLHTYALMIGLWQMHNRHGTLKALEALPGYRLVVPEFKTELSNALDDLWFGALTGGQSSTARVSATR